MLLVHTMLRGGMRNIVIDQVKKPIKAVLISALKILPEPNRKNCRLHNTHILFDIWDKFKEHDHIDRGINNEELWEAVFSLLIVEYEHDPYYRYRFDWLLEEIAKSDWQPRPPGRPSQGWKESQSSDGGEA